MIASIIIVTFNNAKTIKECLESLLKFTQDCQIIVVDNNSQDETREIVRSIEGPIELIESNENLGFAKANNLGVKSAQADFLVFLNPDTVLLQPASLETLIQVLVDNLDYGLLGPRLILANGSVQKSVRNLPSVTKAFKEYVLGKKGAYDFYVPDANRLTEVEAVVGACMVIKKSTFQKAGGFKEKYFLYFEDLQLCKDIKKLGLKVGYYPRVAIKHLEGVSGASSPTFKLSQSSERQYHGVANFCLLQVIYFYVRVLRRLGLKR